MNKTEQEYVDNLAQIGLIAGGGLAGWQMKRYLAKHGYSKLGILTGAVATRLAVEVVGMSAAYAIDGDEGTQSWMRASNTMFSNRTFLDDVPVVGDLVGLLPNPIGVAEVLWDAGVMMGEASLPAFEGAVDFVQGSANLAFKKLLNPPGKFFNPTFNF